MDLYSLGCVGYFLLTGMLVFEGETALQMILQHLQREPVSPAARSGLPIPAALDRLILQCLAKDPEQRPAGAGELAAALTRIALEDDWTDDDARRWWERNLAGSVVAPAASEPTITLDVATE